MPHPYFNGIPVLIGDKVKIKVPGDPAQYDWATVETIVQEEKGLFEAEAPPPYLGLENGYEAFLTKEDAEKHGYDTERTGYIKKHRSMLAAFEARKLADSLRAYANRLDDKAGICRCIGLDHRRECPEWVRPL